MAHESTALEERILEELRRRYAQAAPFRQDRDLAADLALEAAPAVEALLFARETSAPDDVESQEHHEALAMIALLGRRAGGLGVTPTAVLGLLDALVSSFAAESHPLGDAQARALRTVGLEGYMAGCGDRVEAQRAREAVASQPILTVAPRCLALVLSGSLTAEVIEEVVQRFGRALLSADAGACVVDVTRLVGPQRDAMAEVLAADSTARMLGVASGFVGHAPLWLEAARKMGIDTQLLRFEPAFETALSYALPLCGLELRPVRRLPWPLGALWRRP